MRIKGAANIVSRRGNRRVAWHMLLYQCPLWGRSSELGIYCIVSSRYRSLETGNWSQQTLSRGHGSAQRLFRESRESEYPLFSSTCLSLPLSISSPLSRPYIHSATGENWGYRFSNTLPHPFSPQFHHHERHFAFFSRGTMSPNGPQWSATVHLDAVHFGPNC